MKYDVVVKVAASQGGDTVRVQVDADNEAMALVTATLKLEDERKIDRFSLVKIVKATS